MKITWYGHAVWGVETAKAKILIDPFFTGNGAWGGKSWEGAAEGVTHVVLTHGHGDHVGDAVEILKKTGAMLVANYELCLYLVGKGVDSSKINPGNHGGTLDCGGFTTTFVNAVHSSSFVNADGTNTYLGNPAGIVLHFPDEKTIYHMGDTDIFSDMALINELHQPDIGIVPIGDRFTMGSAVAALACRRFMKFETVLPSHYGAFQMPGHEQTADKFVAAMEGSSTKVVVPQIGVAVDL